MAKITDVQEVAVTSLRPYERNAKKHGAEQIEKLKASILEFGFLTPCLIDKEFNLIAGHGRVTAAAELGMETVPCVFIEGLTEAQRKAYVLADNRLGELGEWDMDIVTSELIALDDMDFDVTVTGFEMPVNPDEEELEEDDFPESVETKCKLGDVWKLGNHRLICGDSTEQSVIDTLMNGNKAELLLTDPPYGINIVCHEEGKTGGDAPVTIGKVHGKAKNAILKSKTYRQILGDDTTETAKKSYEISLGYTNNQIIFGGNYFTDFLPPSRCWVVWDKENPGTFADAELAWTSFDKGVKLYRFMWNGLMREGSRKVEGKTRVHPTQKPVGMLGKIIIDFSQEKDNIVDLFGGSGSTLIACEQLNRNCYMCELDPYYCDVIIQRWETLTGGKAELING